MDLELFPITPGEDRLVRFVLQHMLLAYEARASGQLGDIGDFDKDVSEFISRPIPQAVWKEISRLQPEGFRRFVESLNLHDTPRINRRRRGQKNRPTGSVPK